MRKVDEFFNNVNDLQKQSARKRRSSLGKMRDPETDSMENFLLLHKINNPTDDGGETRQTTGPNQAE